ncbi:MAG: 2-amino-4-hydroxy-6-hydroxymethyldihydropteridine diphosphokinase [Desulfobulbaceae bacterium]|nr:2-amino-4-hydroxy-6-hydroxymethyldihydropteridine diphosphokinase [Desulfobulbaceae bacterium]
MHTAYIGLGSNLGDSLGLLEKAWLELGNHSEIKLISLASPYVSKPMDMVSENWFVNSAGSLITTMNPRDLLDFLHQTEEQFGRKRPSSTLGYADRSLDLDLLFYDNVVIDGAGSMVIPHPRLHERLFVLMPLGELAPDLCHPVLHRTIKWLLSDLTVYSSEQEVRRIQWDETIDFR